MGSIRFLLAVLFVFTAATAGAQNACLDDVFATKSDATDTSANLAAKVDPAALEATVKAGTPPEAAKVPVETREEREQRELSQNDSALQTELRSKAIDLANEVTRLEKAIESSADSIGQSERGTLQMMRTKRDRFLYFLETVNTPTEAVNMYRQEFKMVEEGVVMLDAYLKIPEADRSKFMDEQTADAYFVRVGENYGEYKFVRSKMEYAIEPWRKELEFYESHPEMKFQQAETGMSMLESAPSASAGLRPFSEIPSNVKNYWWAYKQLGINKIAEIFPELVIARERPSIQTVERIYRNPKALIAKLEKDLKIQEEIVKDATGWKSWLQANGVRNVLYKLLSIPGLRSFREPVTNLLGLSYNMHVLRIYIESIKLVVYTPGTAKDQLRALAAEAATKSNPTEFLLTFVRLTFYKDNNQMSLWHQLKTEVLALAKEEAKINEEIDKLLDGVPVVETKPAEVDTPKEVEEAAVQQAKTNNFFAWFQGKQLKDGPWLNFLRRMRQAEIDANRYTYLSPFYAPNRVDYLKMVTVPTIIAGGTAAWFYRDNIWNFVTSTFSGGNPAVTGALPEGTGVLLNSLATSGYNWLPILTTGI